MISIIIPVYNQADKLTQCLDRIKKQDYDNYEIIIVDDGSTDNIAEILGEYKKVFGYKLLIIDQTHEGANTARNKGAERARGEFLLFCDADVIMKPEMLAIMHNTLKENPQVSYVYSSFKFGFKIFRLWQFDEVRLKQMPYIHTTSLIRREHFPGFDENIKRLQDWDLWLTMLKKGYTGAWIKQVLFKVKGGGTMSSWIPSFSYKLFPLVSKVKKYKEAVRIIKEKHGL